MAGSGVGVGEGSRFTGLAVERVDGAMMSWIMELLVEQD